MLSQIGVPLLTGIVWSLSLKKQRSRLNNLYKKSIQGDSILIKYSKVLVLHTKFKENKIILTKTRDFTPKKIKS